MIYMLNFFSYEWFGLDLSSIQCLLEIFPRLIKIHLWALIPDLLEAKFPRYAFILVDEFRRAYTQFGDIVDDYVHLLCFFIESSFFTISSQPMVFAFLILLRIYFSFLLIQLINSLEIPP
jgi:hypothetical protein